MWWGAERFLGGRTPLLLKNNMQKMSHIELSLHPLVCSAACYDKQISVTAPEKGGSLPTGGNSAQHVQEWSWVMGSQLLCISCHGKFGSIPGRGGNPPPPLVPPPPS